MAYVTPLVFAAVLFGAAACRDVRGTGMDFCASGKSSRTGCQPAPADKPSFYEDNPTYHIDITNQTSWTTALPETQGVDGALLGQAGDALEEQPAVFSFLVVRNGVLVGERYFHGSARDHSNNVHSTSKGIIGALIGLLLQDHRLQDLDQPLRDLLPGYQFSGRRRDIKLRDLLTMSGGFRWVEDSTEYEIERREEWMQAIIDLPLASSPGKKFNYCTGQTHLMSAVIAAASGTTTKDFAEARLFRPLGITAEHWGQDPQGYNSGGYNLYMTPRALAKFALLYLNQGQLEGRQILPSEWVAHTLEPAQKVDDDYEYGYYWWITRIGGHQIYKLWGYGGQFAYIVPDLNLLVVLTSNTSASFDEMDGDAFIEKFVLPTIRQG